MRPTPVLFGFPRFRPLSLIRHLVLLWLAPLTATAQTIVWQGPSQAEWADAANWSPQTVPNTSGAAVSLTNPAAAGTDLTVGLAGSPFTLGTLTVANTASGNSIVLGSSANDTDILILSHPTQTPSITVSSGALKMNARLEGTQGFTKTGSGTLSFRDNPHPQAFTGPVTLSGGTVVLGADTDLGAADNDITVSGAPSLVADPMNPNQPLVLGPSRSVSLTSSAATLTVTNASPAGSLEIAGPISGSGGLSFGGVGTLSLSGSNTFTGSINYGLPGGTTSGQILSSTLRLVGPAALPSGGNMWLLGSSRGILINSSVTSKIDLGGVTRTITSLRAGNFISSASTDSTVITEISNGSLIINGSPEDVWNPGKNIKTELRLPEVSTINSTGGSLVVGIPFSSSGLNSGRIRIGTSATFNLSSLRMGEFASSGRIDALSPGSFLRIRSGNNTAPSRASIRLGNAATTADPFYESTIDLETGAVDIFASDIRISGARSDYQSTAALKFGSGVVDATTLYLGSGGSNGQLTCSVVQRAGIGRYGTMRFGDAANPGNTLGNVSFVYELHGGRLDIGGISAPGNITVNPTRRLAWYGGTLHNHPTSNSSVLINTTGGTARPIGLFLSGPDAKTVEVDSGKTITLGDGTDLSSTSSDVVLIKTGSGTLILGGRTSGFTGTLQHDQGTLGFGYSATSTTAIGAVQAGAFLWNSGTLACDLSSIDLASDRLVLAGPLTRGSGTAASRVVDLKNSLGAGTYTLATYALTNLTPADFTVAGLRSGYLAEFAAGPTALTVTLLPETALALWRRARFGTALDAGSAADLADPDADGLPNLIEYALGADPLVSDSSAAPLPSLTPSFPYSLQLTFHRIADPALTYTVRAANDPAGPWDEVIFTSTGPDNTDGPITVTDTASLADLPARFLRLVITR